MASKTMETFETDCKQCGSRFTFKAHRTTAQSFCSARCAAKKMTARFRERKTGLKCRVEGCGKNAKYVGDPLCYAHYSRLRRHGSTESKRGSVRYKHSGGYALVKVPDHPLARRTGWAYEHRAVLYDAIGEGPHRCHWCSQKLDWSDIVVDHLNERKDDNSLGNLVVSCSFCNRSRGAMVPFIRGLDDASLHSFIESLKLMRQRSH